MKIQLPIILFFTLGMVPTDEELKLGLSARARFRNVSLDDGKIEKCDFVMGEVPEQYEDVPRFGDDTEIDPSAAALAGEPVGAFFLHQTSKNKWDVQDEDGNVLNTDGPLSKSAARALALENTEED